MRNKKENDDVRNCAFGAGIVVLCDRICAGVPQPFIVQKKRKTDFSAFRLMREMGLEPTRPIEHKILSLACLPISALPRDKVYISTAEAGWQQLFFFFVPGLPVTVQPG